jgi:hypothetical protein
MPHIRLSLTAFRFFGDPTGWFANRRIARPFVGLKAGDIVSARWRKGGCDKWPACLFWQKPCRLIDQPVN